MTAPGAADVDVAHPEDGPACSTGSRLRDEDLRATASLGVRWLLVEVAGGWGWNAWTQSSVLDPSTGRAIARRAEAAGMRVLAIRRHGRARGAPRWRWAIVDTSPHASSIRWGEVDEPAALLEVPLDGSTGTPSTTPIFAVCAHGRHDECCAVRGRSVAGTLAAAHPEETWECSHVGGDRFAATMLLFPHGLNFGRVDDLDPLAIVSDYAEGRIHAAGFRGRTAFAHVEQAARNAAFARFGDDRIEVYAPIRSERVEGTPGAWHVVLDGSGSGSGPRIIDVELAERVSEPLFTTCRATIAVPIRRYRATAIRVRDA